MKQINKEIVDLELKKKFTNDELFELLINDKLNYEIMEIVIKLSIARKAIETARKITGDEK